MSRSFVSVVVVAVIVTSLTACIGPSISLSAKETDLLPCEDRTPVAVEELGDVTRVACNLAGVEILFPDETVVKAPTILASTSVAPGVAQPDPESEYTYSLWNIGVYGIAAARARNDHTSSEWWGTVEALEKLSVLYGDHAPTIWE